MKEIAYKNASPSDGTVKVAEAGTAGNPDAGVLTVQGAPGGTPIPMSLATAPLPSGAATEGGNLAGIRAAVERIPATPATEGGNLAGVRTAVERIPASPATEGGNLAGVRTAVERIPASPAQDGTDATGVVAPAGATGIRGWLSGAYATLVSILAKLNASVAVTGPLTDAQMRTSPVPVSLSGAVEVTNDAGNPLPVSIGAPVSVNATPTNGTRADHSGVITTANTAQVAISANPARRGFSIQNMHTTDPLYINEDGAATTGAGSTKIAAGYRYESPVGAAGVAAVSVLSATVGLAFTAKEW